MDMGMGQSPMGAATAPPEEAPAAEKAGGYTMCLSCLPDGSYAFHVEPLEEAEGEAPSEMGGETEGGNEGQEVHSLEEGLKLMVKYAQAHPMSGSPQEQFESGFKSQQQPPQPKRGY